MNENRQVSRGIRNNNPGNIEYHASVQWNGLADPPSDGRFCRFVDPDHGVRALALLLVNYSRLNRRARDGSAIDTVEDVLHRYAPPKENHTSAYAAFVAKRMNVDPRGQIDLEDPVTLFRLVDGIIFFENGEQPYSVSLIQRAITSAVKGTSLQTSATEN